MTTTGGGDQAAGSRRRPSSKAAGGCAEVAQPQAKPDGGAERPTAGARPGRHLRRRAEDQLRRHHDPARSEDVPEDGGLVRRAGEGRLLRRDGLPSHRARLRDPGRRPDGTGTGGPGYSTRDVPPRAPPTPKGVVAMAKTQAEPPGTAGSQFYIVTAADAGLPPEYALLGKVVEGPGRGRRHRRARRPRQRRAGTPLQPVVIERATVRELTSLDSIGMAEPIEVTDADFQQRVLDRSAQLPVLVDFWADWCQPCHMLAPVIEQAVDAHAGKIELAKLDADHNQATAARYGVRGLPTVKAFRDGEVVDEFTGAQPPLVVERFVAGLVPSEADALVGGGDEESLRRALEVDPDHAVARRELGAPAAEQGRDVRGARRCWRALTGDFVADGPGRARPAGRRRGPGARLRGLGRGRPRHGAGAPPRGAGRPRAARRHPPDHGGDLHRAGRRRPAGARVPPAAFSRP